MTNRIAHLAAIILTIACAAPAGLAQVARPGAPVGAIVVKGMQVKGSDKTRSPLARKRFYLFSGSSKENQPLLKRIDAAEITLRDCFYTQAQASPCLIKWLQEENCESPFCRKVNQEDVSRVKEFQIAYDKGLLAYNKRPDLALAWILNNLSSNFLTAYYLQQRAAIDKILGGLTPVQSIMTTSKGVEATFPGIAATDKPTKFTISNVLPIEIDNKSYVWTCEVDVTAGKTTSLVLSTAKRPGCVLVTKDLKICGTGACEAK